jgi:hypothetical protein
VGYRAFKLLRVQVVADEAEEIAGQSAQHAFGGQFLKTLDGKDDVDIHVGVVMRIFQLMDDQGSAVLAHALNDPSVVQESMRQIGQWIGREASPPSPKAI